MLKFENTQVFGWESAIIGMRNPMNSWNHSDTNVSAYSMSSMDGNIIIGPKDHELAMKLVKAGSEHGKWLRMIQVWVNITAPRYWWSEFDTYKVGTTANSQSTMHKLKDVNFNDKSVVDFPWGVDQEADVFMYNILQGLSLLQSRMNEYKKDESKQQYVESYHRVLKSLLPEGFYQTRTVNLNYAVLRNMYRQRKNHRLPQWSEDFVSWIKTLPYSEFITTE
jgi:hypothetical protein